jgi:hypothetical protein
MKRDDYQNTGKVRVLPVPPLHLLSSWKAAASMENARMASRSTICPMIRCSEPAKVTGTQPLIAGELGFIKIGDAGDSYQQGSQPALPSRS